MVCFLFLISLSGAFCPQTIPKNILVYWFIHFIYSVCLLGAFCLRTIPKAQHFNPQVKLTDKLVFLPIFTNYDETFLRQFSQPGDVEVRGILACSSKVQRFFLGGFSTGPEKWRSWTGISLKMQTDSVGKCLHICICILAPTWFLLLLLLLLRNEKNGLTHYPTANTLSKG